MLSSVLWILLMGLVAGQIARRFGAPPLIGMILIGIFLGSQSCNLISSDVLNAAGDLRTLPVMIILMKAGLELDGQKLAQQKTVALRLGFLPATVEAIVIALCAMVIFKFDFATGLLLGCIVGTESLFVIVPAMSRLKSLGWGVTKGIPDAILAGSVLSNVLLLLVFSLLVSFLSGSGVKKITLFGGFTFTTVQLLPFLIIMHVLLGVAFGYIAAWLLAVVLTKQKWTQNVVQDTIIAASLALFLVIYADIVPKFSGYLAVMAMGFFLRELDAPLARNLCGGFDSLWIVAEIFLFVLLGATIQLQVLENIFLPGISILAISLLIGRMIGWYLSTLGSNWNWQEKLFLLLSNSASSTVQVTIVAIPLPQEIPGGEIILAVAALSILVTAPLCAWATPTFAPKLLERGEVDLTKVTVATRSLYLAAVDTSSLTKKVLTHVADLARRSNGEVIVLHVLDNSSAEAINKLSQQAKQLLCDIKYILVIITGAIPEKIISTAKKCDVTEIIMGKRGHQLREQVLIGSVSQAVLSASLIPVIIVE